MGQTPEPEHRLASAPDLPPSLCWKPHRFPAVPPTLGPRGGCWSFTPEQPRGAKELWRTEVRAVLDTGIPSRATPCPAACGIRAHGPPWRGLRPKPRRGWPPLAGGEATGGRRTGSPTSPWASAVADAQPRPAVGPEAPPRASSQRPKPPELHWVGKLLSTGVL